MKTHTTPAVLTRLVVGMVSVCLMLMGCQAPTVDPLPIKPTLVHIVHQVPKPVVRETDVPADSTQALEPNPHVQK